MISGIVRVEFLNQRPSFASKTHQDLEAQHGDIDLIATVVFITIIYCSLFIFYFIYSEKVDPKPDIRIGHNFVL